MNKFNLAKVAPPRMLFGRKSRFYLYFLSFMLAWMPSSVVLGQSDSFCGALPPHSASEGAENIYSDRFGNTYSESDLSTFSYPEALFGDCANSGFFTIQFVTTPGSSPWTNDEMETACAVFDHVSNLVASTPPNGAIIVQLSKDITCGSAAAATPIWGLGCGITNTILYEQIVSGNPDLPNGFISAIVCIKPEPSPGNTWHTLSDDCSSTNACLGTNERDLYSALLHEALHMVGFASRIGINGDAIGGLYSTWDRFLYFDQSDTYVIDPTSDPSCCDSHTFSGSPQDLEGGCERDIYFFGGTGTIAEVNDFDLVPANDAAMANKLSHLDNECNSGKSFLMHPNLGFGPGSEIRTLTPEEKTILCHLGYNSNLCNSCSVNAMNDGPYTIITSQSPSITIDISDLKANDHYPMGSTISLCGSDSDISVSLTGSMITVTGSSPGIFSFCYRHTGCDGWCDDASVTVYVREEPIPISCPNTDCNLVCFGDFEDFLPGTGNYYSQMPSLSPFMFNVGGSNPIRGNSSDVRLASGNQFLKLFTCESNFCDREGVEIPLSSPIEPGCTATISWNGRAETGTANIVATTQFYAIDASPCATIPYPTSCLGASQICPGVDAACMTGSNTNGVPIVSSQQFQPYSFSWTNQTQFSFSSLLVFVGDNSGTFTDFTIVDVDDLVVTTSCANEIEVSSQVISQCIDGSGQIEYEVCLTGNGTSPVKISLDLSGLSIPGISIATTSDFDQNGNIEIELIPGGPCETLTLNLNIAPNFSVGTEIPISLSAAATEFCYNGTNSGALTTLVLEDCVTTTLFPCGCENVTYNYDAGDPDGVGMTPAQLGMPADFTGVPCVAIRGKLRIPKNTTLNLTGAENIFMQPGSSIVLEDHWTNSGGELILNDNHLQGCVKMWRGITVENNARLSMSGTNLENAQFGITFEQGGIAANMSNNTFDKNHVGVRALAWFQNPNDFKGNNFMFTDDGVDLLPLYDDGLTQYDATSGYAGMLLQNVGWFSLGKTNEPNFFTGTRNGIVADKSTFEVWYTHFNDFDGTFGNFDVYPALAGTGIGLHESDLNLRYSSFSGEDDKGINAYNSKMTVYQENSFNTDYGISFYAQNGVNKNMDIWQSIFDYGTVGIISNTNAGAVNLYQIGNQGDWAKNTFTGDSESEKAVWADGGDGFIGFNDFNIPSDGVFIQNGDSYWVERNNFKFLPSSTIGSNTGVELDGTNNSTVFENHFWPQSFATNNYKGIHLASAQANAICCNTLDNLGESGVSFMGICSDGNNPSHIRRNAFNTIEFAALRGLHGQVASQLGIQTPHGVNTWSGLFTIAEAVHEGTQADIDLSRFYELPQNHPATVIGNGWFKFFGGEPAKGCSTDPICGNLGAAHLEKTELSPEDLKVIGGFDLDNPFGEVLVWEGRKNLFAQMMQNPQLAEQNVSAATFFAETQEESIGQLYQIAQALKALFEVSETDKALILQHEEAISSLKGNISDLNEQLKVATTDQEKMNISTQKVELFSELTNHVAQIRNINQQIDEYRTNQANEVIALNDAVSDVFLFERNEKIVNDVYLKAVIKGSGTLDDIQFQQIKAVAEQCPLEGGNAVYRARSLYQLRALKSFDDQSLCHLAKDDVQGASEQSTTDTRFSIQPNPTNAFVNVFWPLDAKSLKDVRVDVLKPSGNLMRSFTFTGKTGSKELDLNIQPGIYTCNFYIDGQFVESQTVVIIE